MSNVELSTASACVDAISSTFLQAVKILQRNKNGPESGPRPEARDLEKSLKLGERNTREQYERCHKRFGGAYARGDQTAVDALTRLLADLQEQLVTRLEAQGLSADLLALQDVADGSQDKCILVLMQLSQRIIASGPTDNVTPPPLNTSSLLNRSLPATPQEESGAGETSSSEAASSMNFATERHLSPGPARSGKPLTPPRSPQPLNVQHVRSNSRLSVERSISEDRFLSELRPPSQNQYRPMATTVSKPGLFGFGKRTKVEAVIEPPENPLVDEYLTTAILDEYRGIERAERASSVSTTRSSIFGNSMMDVDPATSGSPERESPTPLQSHSRSESRLRGSLEVWRSRSPPVHQSNLEVLMSNRSLSSIKPEDMLPSEMNSYGGFCKGAWRQQIGDKKRSMEERTRPGGMYNASRYWQCRQCKFEGRLVVMDKKNSKYDMRVFRLVDGIQFRWEFMFKSHMYQGANLPDPTHATYGCIFCCSEGKGTPTFVGIEKFMIHLIEHRDPLPTGEVLYRMNCLVGRQAGTEDDFDINFVSREGGLL